MSSKLSCNFVNKGLMVVSSNTSQTLFNNSNSYTV